MESPSDDKQTSKLATRSWKCWKCLNWLYELTDGLLQLLLGVFKVGFDALQHQSLARKLTNAGKHWGICLNGRDKGFHRLLVKDPEIIVLHWHILGVGSKAYQSLNTYVGFTWIIQDVDQHCQDENKLHDISTEGIWLKRIEADGVRTCSEWPVQTALKLYIMRVQVRKAENQYPWAYI